MTRREILTKRIELLARELRPGEDADLQRILGQHAVSGILSSGATVTRRHSRRVETSRELLAQRLRLERDYAFTPEDEAGWYDDLKGAIWSISDRESARIQEALEADCRRFAGGTAEPFLEQARQDIKQFREQAFLEAEIVQGEREHRKRITTTTEKELPSRIVLNISNSQVAGLNVGGAVGSIQATVNVLETAGDAKVAEALKKLAEAIAQETSFTDTAKRESLELVSSLGDEIARPRDQHRTGALRAVGASLGELLEHSDKVYASYELLKTALRAAWGLELP